MSEITRPYSTFPISLLKPVRRTKGWRAGQKFVFVPKGKGVLVMPVPEAEVLFGLAKGANTENYRDGENRL